LEGLLKIKVKYSFRTLFLKILAVILWIGSLLWFLYEPGFEPLLSVIGGIVSFIASFPSSSQPSNQQSQIPLKKSDKQLLLEKVDKLWIKGLLQTILSEHYAIEISKMLKPSAVIKRWDNLIAPEISETNINQLFIYFDKRLLILGAPGSGKTVLLLRLSEALVKIAQTDGKQPIPVILSLSSWNGANFLKWIFIELHEKYEQDTRQSKNLLENGQITLLLDGLDEVKPEIRSICVDEINSFAQNYPFIALVISSREEEYTSGGKLLNLEGAVVLQPLNNQQIDMYLQGDEYKTLRKAIAEDTSLQEMARVPFLLNAMATAYRNVESISLLHTFSLEERRNHLLQSYIEKRFKYSDHSNTYTLKQSLHYLTHLSQVMLTNNLAVFYPLPISLGYLENSARKKLYSIAISVYYGVGLGVATFLLFTLINNFRVSLFNGILIGLIFCFIYFFHTKYSLILYSIISKPSEKTKEKSLTKKTVKDNVQPQDNRKNPKGTRLVNITAGCTWYLIIFLSNAMFSGLAVSYLLVFFNPQLGLFLGITLWGVGWLIPDMLSIVLDLTSSQNLQSTYGALYLVDLMKTRGKWGVILDAIIVMFFVGVINLLRQLPVDFVLDTLVSLILFLLFKYLFILLEPFIIKKQSSILWETASNFISLFICISISLTPIIGILFSIYWIMFRLEGRYLARHFVVRLIMYFYGQAPFNLRQFLDEMAKLVIVRQVGDGYIFMHRYLMEYLGSKENNKS